MPGSSGPGQKPIDLSVNNLDYRSLPARIISFFSLARGVSVAGVTIPLLNIWRDRLSLAPCMLQSRGKVWKSKGGGRQVVILIWA